MPTFGDTHPAMRKIDDAIAECESDAVTDTRTQAELEDSFRSNWWDARSLARRSVEAAWRAGEALAELKARLPHGDWMGWLDDREP